MRKLNLKIYLTSILIFYTYSVNTQWLLQNIPVNKPVSDICFINDQTGWACTAGEQYNSEVLKTTNGGVNWIIQYADTNIAYTNLNVLNSADIYVSGDSLYGLKGKLKRTTNGGTVWLNCNLPANLRIKDMQFINTQTGWISGNGVSLLYITNDGGLNWILRSSGITAQVQNIFFINTSTGYCSSDRNLYKTTNSGINWINLHYFNETVNAVFFLNNNTGWICAANPGPPDNKIYYTTDGGVSWSTQTTPVTGGISTSVCFINGQTGWSGNRTNYIFKTTNSGLNWGYQVNPSKSYRIFILDSLRGWTCDNGISSTITGGGPIIFTGINIISTEIPSEFKLFQNYPNPFNPYTTIKLDISKSSVIKLYISDVLGKVHYEVINQYLVPGKYEFNWDSRDYSSGVYFYTLISDKFIETKKMLLVK